MSGIYIKGLGMPTECYGLRMIIYPNGQVIIPKSTYWEEPNGVEAIPVPDHGRLIDADALVLPPNLNDWNSVAEYVENIADCWKAVDNATTIIPADMEKKDT